MTITTQIIWMALAALTMGVVVWGITFGLQRARIARLRKHFGEEYDRVVGRAGSRAAAERELQSRTLEVETFGIKPLPAVRRAQFRNDWIHVRNRFVDSPAIAIGEADELIGEIMTSRGYPVADFNKHAEHLSVKHPNAVNHYRAGHAIFEAQEHGTASTEDLRQALLHYQALFTELIGTGQTNVARDLTNQREIATEPVSSKDGHRTSHAA